MKESGRFSEEKLRKRLSRMRALVPTRHAPRRLSIRARLSEKFRCELPKSSPKLLLWMPLLVVLTGKASAQTAATPGLQNYMQNLMKNYVKQEEDFSVFIGDQPGFSLASNTNANGTAKFPEPPNTDLQHEVASFLGSLYPASLQPIQLQTLWLPQQKLGAIYTVEGSGAYSYYLFFAARQNYTYPIATPSLMEKGIEGTYGDAGTLGGEEGFLAYRDHHVLALVFEMQTPQYSGSKDYIFNLSWQGWTGAGWGPIGSVTINSTSWPSNG